MSGPLSALVLASAWCGALGWEAACQCTTDGWSGGEDYVPEDAEFFSTGEKPYRFKIISYIYCLAVDLYKEQLLMKQAEKKAKQKNNR